MAALIIGLLALAVAVLVVVAAARRHREEIGDDASWSDLKDSFSVSALGGVREESALLADPDPHASDIGVGQLFNQLGEDGAGYLEPRDLLDRHGLDRHVRN